MESVREVKITVHVDTNKRTEQRTFEWQEHHESALDVADEAREYLERILEGIG